MTSAGWEQWIADFKAGRIERGPATPMREVREVFMGEELAREVEGVANDYPPPEVSSRDGTEPPGAVWPGPVIKLVRQAIEAGWGTAPAYARGCMPHATTGRPGAPRDSFSVRFVRDGWQGYAIYAAGGWQSIMVTGTALPPFGMLGRTDLSAWLADPWPAGDARYDEVRRRVALQKEQQKERAKSRPKKGSGEAL